MLTASQVKEIDENIQPNDKGITDDKHQSNQDRTHG